MRDVYLESSRLFLREFTMEDLDAVHLYATDPLVVKFVEWGPNDERETVGFLGKAVKNQGGNPRYYYDLAVVQRTDNRLIGACALHLTESNQTEAALGYCFNRDYWGKGFASEAAGEIIRFGFQDLGLHRIFATCDIENTGSARVMEKVGMSKEGLLRENRSQKGVWRSSLIYSILEPEYKLKIDFHH